MILPYSTDRIYHEIVNAEKKENIRSYSLFSAMDNSTILSHSSA
jgi:L-rhamnose mutarotase